MREEIPALPVLTPLVVLTVALLAVRLHRRGGLTLLRAATVTALAVYVAGVLAHTMFPIPLGPDDDAAPWYVWINLVPFLDIADDPIGLTLNVLLFVPLGALVPLVSGRMGLGRTVLTGFLASLGIEVLQFVADLLFSIRRVADVDDLIANTAGVLIGYAVFRALCSIPVLKRLAQRAAWPRRSTAPLIS